MPELAQNRMSFIDQLHEIFLIRKGYGAFAFISTTDALSLFDQYVDSDKPADMFIDHYMRSRSVSSRKHD